jgi:site-specific recombinase XerD
MNGKSKSTPSVKKLTQIILRGLFLFYTPSVSTAKNASDKILLASDRSGTDTKFIQELMGHADIQTTMRYLHVSKQSIKKIISPLDKM